MVRRGTGMVGAALFAAALAGCGGGDTADGAGADGAGADGAGAASAAADPERGEQLFAAHCAVCHGSAGQGTASGPPLVHEIYEPGHHSDASFHLAVNQGVRAHHWNFGDMPPIPGLSSGEVDDIVAWVRQQQRAAGIE
ncbi:cytochrome c [Egicoccus sp. AB-alg2]|uniref:c-type cytochrome n=1 Tax=Egicoccus sp. AB-alg2 TaxID=3242693 RepID=UPI00359E5456